MLMDTRKAIAFHTLGCKLNFSETDAIARKIKEEGHSTVGFDETADIYVINSCTVTQKAEKRCRDSIKKIRRLHPGAQIVVMGCYSQVRANTLRNIPGVSLVLDNTKKFALHAYLENPDAEPGYPATHHPPSTFIPAYSSGGARTRTFFKIQDGCDYGCAYCAIPLARGHSRSNTIAQTVALARKIADTGTREMVLTGVNIGDFGKNHGETLIELLKRLTEIPTLPRIRLSSIEPDLLHDDIISLAAREPALMPHFHLPIQSGSNTILASMGRRYATDLVADRVRAIREIIPRACIAADIIAGYPGETETLFDVSYTFLKNTDVSYLHVFPYSEREDTPAAKSTGKVHPAERKRRSRLLQALSQEKKKRYIAGSQNTTAQVLWENQSRNGFMYGFTENYLKAKTPYDPARANTIEHIRLEKTDTFGTFIV